MVLKLTLFSYLTVVSCFDYILFQPQVAAFDVDSLVSGDEMGLTVTYSKYKAVGFFLVIALSCRGRLLEGGGSGDTVCSAFSSQLSSSVIRF